MSTKRVAVEGEVTATAGSGMSGYTDSPGWVAGSVSYQTHSHLKVGGKPVIWKASCTFTYSGVDGSGNPPPSNTETVELSAKGTILEPSASHALLHGDSAQGSKAVSQNKLEVAALGPLQSDPS